MGSVVSALTGGGSGAGFQAQSANVINPATQAQADEQYKQAQAALAQQQAFANQVAGLQGTNKLQDVYGQYSNIAQGQGPNPAQAMLANATSQNVANLNAALAGQRNSSAAPGTIARQAAIAGSAAQQNAAGQAAGLQAQQSLAALGQMGNIGQNAMTAQGQATSDYNRLAQNEQGQILGAIAQQNQANIANTEQQNKAQAEIAKQNAANQSNLMGNLAGAAGTALAGPLGGMIANYFTSKATTPSGNEAESTGGGGRASVMKAEGGVIGGPKSRFGQHVHGVKMAQGGKVPALLSPGERYLSPDKVEAVKQGANPMAVGEKVPGKPKVGGAKNSYANDTVPATLEEGGIVIPRSITQGPNPHWEAMRFVAKTLKEEKSKSPKGK